MLGVCFVTFPLSRFLQIYAALGDPRNQDLFAKPKNLFDRERTSVYVSRQILAP
jgi:hypothetical protein